MILLEAQQVVIATPPHTASGNLHRALCAPPYNGNWVIGPGPGGAWDHHVVDVASGWSQFRKALVVRDPAERLVGLYLHHRWCVEHPDSIGYQLERLTWEMFVERACLGMLEWNYHYTIRRLVGERRFDHLVRYERLVEDVSELVGQPLALADPYHGPVDYEEYYRLPAVRCAVEEWGREDRIAYGYWK